MLPINSSLLTITLGQHLFITTQHIQPFHDVTIQFNFTLHENPLHSSQIGVWCAVSRKLTVGPLSFGQTFTAENCPKLSTQFSVLLEENKWSCCSSEWGVRHIANTRTTFLQVFFGDRTVRRAVRPPRSLDHQPPDFSLSRFLKASLQQ